MNLTFYGATENVTGSKHLLQVNGFKLLLDCGAFQGRRSEANDKNRNLPFDASGIDAVILSHAHLDHSGALPNLVKNGFAGKIYCTSATKEIVKYILEDSAELQAQDARYFNKHIRKESEAIKPLYSKEDVRNTLQKLVTVPYFRENDYWQIINENIKFKFLEAGHILGSAITVVQVNDSGVVKNLVYTGDLGRSESPILKSPEFPIEDIDNLIIESTYGNKNHRPIIEAENELKELINFAVSKKSKIIVPAFALGRTQELIYILHKLTIQKRIPQIKIFIDSPMAINITELFDGHEKDFDFEWWQDFGKQNIDVFTAQNIYFTKSSEKSQEINNMEGPMIIISASGMCEGGRVLHHLKNSIGNRNNIILLAGYQAENTLGRRLLNGQKFVKIFGLNYEVKAKVLSLDELSAHADQVGLLKYIENCKNLKNLFLVHGEKDSLTELAKKTKEINNSLSIDVPVFSQEFEI